MTTEGGLDVVTLCQPLSDTCARLQERGVRVSLFIDADPRQVAAAVKTGAAMIELHTGRFADAVGQQAQLHALERVEEAARQGLDQGLQVNAGHGLNYHNVQAIAAIPGITELNIGHAIIARAVFVGLESAVREMKRLMIKARSG